MSKIKLALLAAALVLPAGGAFANGCNGVVNQLVWGCAAWDNNNGPQYPNWHGVKPAPAPVTRPYAPPASSLVSPGNGSGIVAQGGGNIVAQGGGNIVAQGGGNMRGH